MVIQRWQSLLLFIAVILTAIFCLVPFAILGEPENISIYPVDAPCLLVVSITTAVLLFITIFLYKNLKLQMRIATICIALLICSIAIGLVFTFTTFAGADIIWTGGLVLLFVALICAIAARRLMKKDHDLLRSYDRMR